jgi:hypothetical protein
MKRVFLKFAGHLLVGCLATACGSGAGSGVGSGQESALSALTVTSGSLSPAFDPNVTDYSVTSMTSLYPVAVTATTLSPSATLTIHGASAKSGVPSSFTLLPKEDFTVAVRAPAGESTTYTVHYLPPDFPAYTVSSSAGAGTEDVLLTAGNTYLLIVDRSGAPLYFRSFLPNQVLNFQQHRLIGEEIFYSAAVGMPTGAWSLGTDHLMDATFHDVGDVHPLANEAHDDLQAEAHDFMLLDEDHYVTMSYVQRTVNLARYNPRWSSAAPVMNVIVQEVDHGLVLFEWDSGDVPSLYSDSTDGNSFADNTVSDYLHLNSIEIDPEDGNFIFSLRHTNSVVKVDRTTAKILWTLGGAEDNFGLTSDQTFSHQHDVRKEADGSLTVFDNGNNAHQTRAISFFLDELSKKVLSFRVIYRKPDDQPQTSFMGSLRLLDTDRYMIGWGGGAGKDVAPAATEVLNGASVWQLTFSSPTAFSYRALPVDRSYRTQ